MDNAQRIINHKKREKNIKRFMKYVRVTNTCWFWEGALKGGGYGNVWFNGRRRGAHRVAYELFSGKAPDPTLVVMHSCDTPNCVNPNHLKEGTRKDNMQDASRKGRTRNVNDWRGTKNPKAKLTLEKRQALENGIIAKRGTKELSNQFNISRVRVQQIAREIGLTYPPYRSGSRRRLGS